MTGTYYLYMSRETAEHHGADRVKFSDSIDQLPPDALVVKRVSRPMSLDGISTVTNILEGLGLQVCVDLSDYFYETEEK